MAEKLIKITELPRVFTTEEFMLKDLLGRPETVEALARRLGLYGDNVNATAVEKKLARLGVTFENVKTAYGRLGGNGTFNAGAYRTANSGA